MAREATVVSLEVVTTEVDCLEEGSEAASAPFQEGTVVEAMAVAV